jgi:hypothetical protein
MMGQQSQQKHDRPWVPDRPRFSLPDPPDPPDTRDAARCEALTLAAHLAHSAPGLTPAQRDAVTWRMILGFLLAYHRADHPDDRRPDRDIVAEILDRLAACCPEVAS